MGKHCAKGCSASWLGMNAAIKVEATRTRLFLVVVVIGGTARKSAYRAPPSA